MKFFKKPDASVWSFEEDGSQDAWVSADMVLMSPAEVAAHNAPTPEQAAAAVKAAQDSIDAAAARLDAKLAALAIMTPVQVRAWVMANVNSLGDAKDALATLAIAVSVLARRL